MRSTVLVPPILVPAILIPALLALAACSGVRVEPDEPATWSKDVCEGCGPGLFSGEAGALTIVGSGDVPAEAPSDTE
ncbi:MAG: hypothetical protein AAFR52_19900 [Pseudomonadota bacterium]